MRLSPRLAFLLLRLLPSTVTPSFLFNIVSPLTPPPCVWPTVLSLRADPPACPLPELRAALPSQAAAPASPAPRAAAAISGASRNRPARCGRRGSRQRRGGTWEPPGSRLSSDGRRCQLRSSRSAPGGARLAGLGAELRGVGCYFVIFSSQKSGLWGKEWGDTQRPRQLRNSSVGCGVSVPLTIVTCLAEGEPQRAGPGRQMGGERERDRASGVGGTQRRRARESERARDFESIVIVRPSGYLCAATLASTTPTFRTQDLTESISAPSDFSFRAGPLPKVS